MKKKALCGKKLKLKKNLEMHCQGSWGVNDEGNITT